MTLVGTPIGNLDDLSPRAARALRRADAIAAEDTRVARKLLAAHEIAAPAPMLSCRAENEERMIPKIIALLREGRNVALVADAGMPAVSDPGSLLVAAVRAAGLRVEVVPGPSAPTAALALAGFAGKGFAFVGFAPRRKARILRMFARVAEFPGPIVAFESPRRLARTLPLAREALGERRAFIAFELTKRHERGLSGSLSELAARARALENEDGLRGEATLVIAPGEKAAEEDREENGREAGETRET